MVDVIQGGESQVDIDARAADWADYNARVADGTVAEEEATSRFDTESFKDLKALALVMADIAGITPAQLKTQFIAKRKSLSR